MVVRSPACSRAAGLKGGGVIAVASNSFSLTLTPSRMRCSCPAVITVYDAIVYTQKLKYSLVPLG